MLRRRAGKRGKWKGGEGREVERGGEKEEGKREGKEGRPVEMPLAKPRDRGSLFASTVYSQADATISLD